jgi:hypothetical protein
MHFLLWNEVVIKRIFLQTPPANAALGMPAVWLGGVAISESVKITQSTVPWLR